MHGNVIFSRNNTNDGVPDLVLNEVEGQTVVSVNVADCQAARG